jgi:hypothetical protein
LDTSNYSSMPDASAFAALGAILGAFFLFFVILGIALYIFQGFVYYRIYKKAGVKYPGLSWVPVANMVPFFWTIKKSAWNILWLIVPSVIMGIAMGSDSKALLIVGVLAEIAVLILGIWWMVRFLKAFRINPHWLWFGLALIIPIVNLLVGIAFLVLLCIIAFNKNITYDPNFDAKV